MCMGDVTPKQEAEHREMLIQEFGDFPAREELDAFRRAVVLSQRSIDPRFALWRAARKYEKEHA